MPGPVKAVENLVSKAGKAVESVGKKVGGGIEKAGKGLGKVVENVAKNPLPLIEAAILISAGVPPPIASATVSAANGGSMKDIVNAGVTAYVGENVASSVGGQLPEGTSATTAKAISSAAGADAATTLNSLASGKNINQALQDGLVAGASTGAGVVAGAQVENKIGSGAASGAAAGATGAALTGKDIGSAALTGAGQGALKPAADVAVGAAKDFLGDIKLPDVTGGTDVFKGIREATAPYVDPIVSAAKQVGETVKPYVEPVVSAAQEKLKPLGEAISSVGESVKQATAPIVEKIESTDFSKNPLVQAAGEIPNLYHDQNMVKLISQGGPAPVAQGVSTGTTVGLTGERGAGEIESKETGKPRQNVWNEASLRLKDALGV